jgi:hypothetical protein
MGILLLLLCVLAGYCLLKQFVKFNRPVVTVIGSFLVGCLLSGTLLYILDLTSIFILNNYEDGTLLFIVIATLYIGYRHKQASIWNEIKNDILSLLKDPVAIVSFITFSIFSAWLNYHSLSLTPSVDIIVAGGAWSDIIYHHAYVRSVAIGNNVPTEYPYFANKSINYHFMFNYYVGKLSQFGLHSIHALNIMSTLGLLSLLMLILEFGRALFKSTATGILGALCLVFHSSYSAFDWLKNNLDGALFKKIFEKQGWLTGAELETWGLFNLNVFINQRHLPFTLAILVLLVLYIIKYREETDISVSDVGKDFLEMKQKSIDYKKIREPLFWALIVGALPFWNILLSVVCLLFMGVFALLNYKKRDFLIGLLIPAGLASAIVYPQILLFKSGETVLSEYPKVHFGYALMEPSLIDFFLYYLHVFGFKLIFIFLAVLIVRKQLRLDLLVFLIPFIIANMFQLGKILYDNNKLIFSSLIFINCYAAYFIVFLVKKHRAYMALPATILFLSITIAGVIDFFAIKNIVQLPIADESSSLKRWIINNTKPSSTFLTNTSIPYHDSSISTINLAGRVLYVVRNCVDSSCYIDNRLANARKIYSFDQGVDSIRNLLKAEIIDYILIDNLVRNNSQLSLNEEALEKNFNLVYKDQEVSIFSSL